MRYHLNVILICLSFFNAMSVFANSSIQAGGDERIEVKGKGFSIQPPEGWEVIRSELGLMLLMQSPKDPSRKFRSSIKVKFGQEAIIIDKIGADRFGEVIERKSGEAFGSNYKNTESALITLADGSPGVLYYSEFIYDDTPLMEMHILVSSKKGHFLLTYTDLPESFESNGPGTPLDIAYSSMSSVRLDSQSGGRFDIIILALIGGSCFMLLLLALRFFFGRHRISSEDLADESEFHSDHSIDTQMDSGVDELGDPVTSSSSFSALEISEIPKSAAESSHSQVSSESEISDNEALSEGNPDSWHDDDAV